MDEHVKKTAPEADRRDREPLVTGFWRFWMFVEILIAVLLLVGLGAALSS